MKSLTKLSILAGAILLISAAVNAGIIVNVTTTIGYIGQNDRLLATEYVFKPSSLSTNQTAEVVYPPEGQTNYVNLTAIELINLGSPFGSITLRDGGPGFPYSTVDLGTEIGTPLNYKVQYYG